MTQAALLDWTEGAEGIVWQHCPACGHGWYFRRTFCPKCGAGTPETRQASGAGTVHAITRVMRAPSEALRPYAPYNIALVDLDEGLRVMAHADDGVAIGDRVTAAFVAFGDRTVPRFSKV
jgi:uncharacterized OB-fold protein